MAPSFTKFYPRTACSAAMLLTLAIAAVPGASAQINFTRNKEGSLQDASQFYMARRQVQVVDDSPIVKFSGGGGGGAQGGSGAVPTGAQMALPRAGFQSYTSATPSITTPLPKVNNGVPPKPSPQEEAAMRAKADSLRKAQAKAAAAAAHPKTPPPPEGMKAYNSYKGYNPAASIPSSSGAASSNMSTAGQVKGNILHWNKKRGGG